MYRNASQKGQCYGPLAGIDDPRISIDRYSPLLVDIGRILEHNTSLDNTNNITGYLYSASSVGSDVVCNSGVVG